MATPAATHDAVTRTSIMALQRAPSTLKLGAFILAVFVFVAVTAPLWAPYSPTRTGIAIPFSRASVAHPFGTDELGRDVLSRVLFGTRDVLALSITSTFIAVLLGGSIGLWCGYVGGWIDEVLMRVFEILISIPLLIFAMLTVTAVGDKLGGSPLVLLGVIVITYVPRVARVVRAAALDVVHRDFVTIARSRGEGSGYIVFRELWPNTVGVMLVEFGIRAGYAPILIGSLGFLGFGLRPPSPEWGLMISENLQGITVSPETVLAPALAISVLVIGLNLVADGLARQLGRATSAAPL